MFYASGCYCAPVEYSSIESSLPPSVELPPSCEMSSVAPDILLDAGLRPDGIELSALEIFASSAECPLSCDAVSVLSDDVSVEADVPPLVGAVAPSPACVSPTEA